MTSGPNKQPSAADDFRERVNRRQQSPCDNAWAGVTHVPTWWEEARNTPPASVGAPLTPDAVKP